MSPQAGHELQKMTFGVLDRCAPPSTDLWWFSFPIRQLSRDTCMLFDFLLSLPTHDHCAFSSPFDSHDSSLCRFGMHGTGVFVYVT